MALIDTPSRSPLRAEVAAALGGKENVGVAAALVAALESMLANVATSGSYADLIGQVPTSALPALAINDVFTVGSQAAMLALTAQRGDVAVRSDLTAAFILAADAPTVLANWVRLPTPADAVLSVNGQTGVVTITKAGLGLDQVANVAPANLPVSAATAAALALKLDLSVFDAKGDLVFGSGPDAVTRFAVGADNSVLTADSTQPLGVKWAAPAAGGGSGIRARTSTGRFIAVFGPCSNSGSWTVCPNAWRPPPIVASVGNLIDLRAGGVLGATNSSGDAEFDVAAIDNSDSAAPVILRCLSSNSATPLPNGDGDLYAWANNARVFKGVQDWVVQSGDLVNGTLVLAILYRAGGSGLSFGHGSVYPNHVNMINYGTPAGA